MELGEQLVIEVLTKLKDGSVEKNRHYMNPIQKDDFIKYNGELGNTSKNLRTRRGVESTDHLDKVTAVNLRWWAKLVDRVEGYTLKGKDVMELPDWKALMLNWAASDITQVMVKVMVPYGDQGMPNVDQEEEDARPLAEISSMPA